MSSCCVPGCSNRAQQGYKFYRIPRGPHPFKTHRRRLWLEAIKREDWTENIIRNARICGAHFISGEASLDWQSPDFVPSIFVNTKQRNHRKRRRDDRANKPLDQSGPEEPGQSNMEHSHGDASVNDEKKRCLKRKRDEETLAKQKLENMISGNDFDIKDLQVQHVQLLKAFTEMQTEADRLRSENKRLEGALQSDFSKLSYRFLKCDDEQLLFLTGLHAVAFDWLVPKIARSVIRVHPEVNPQDHLLIVLMKLKLGLSDNDLGYRFQICGGIITAMCQTWIPALAAVLSPLITWPSDGTIVKTKPSIFKGRVRQCRCIVDTLEVTVATPTATTKVVSYLIGATPAGAISFVSPGFFCRKKSDRQLLKESGFMDVLKPMDLLLANKTFPVQKELDAIGATLLTPDIAKGKKSATTKAMDFPVAVWSHVEKVLDWWKDFGVFQTAVPADYEEMLDDVVVICAALNNVKMGLVPKAKNTKKCKT